MTFCGLVLSTLTVGLADRVLFASRSIETSARS